MTTVNALFGILFIVLDVVLIIQVTTAVIELVMLIREWRNDDLS